MKNTQNNKFVFFDVDGTLHQQDLFLSLIQYTLKKRWLIGLLFLPLLLLGVLAYIIFNKHHIGLNIILYALFFGLTPSDINRIIDDFHQQFYPKLILHHKVLDRLYQHLHQGDVVFLISGSPTHILYKFYPSLINKPNIVLISSTLQPKYHSHLLYQRCYRHQKVIMADAHHQQKLYFRCGYSDSKDDLPIFERCLFTYWIKNGDIIKNNISHHKNNK